MTGYSIGKILLDVGVKAGNKRVKVLQGKVSGKNKPESLPVNTQVENWLEYASLDLLRATPDFGSHGKHNESLCLPGVAKLLRPMSPPAVLTGNAASASQRSDSLRFCGWLV